MNAINICQFMRNPNSNSILFNKVCKRMISAIPRINPFGITTNNWSETVGLCGEPNIKHQTPDKNKHIDHSLSLLWSTFSIKFDIWQQWFTVIQHELGFRDSINKKEPPNVAYRIGFPKVSGPSVITPSAETLRLWVSHNMVHSNKILGIYKICYPLNNYLVFVGKYMQF